MTIRLERIGKSFNGVTALEEVSLEIRPGEALALLGENGAGKSTLIKILSGVHRASEGRMLVNEKSVAPVTPHEAVELGIGVVHQERNLVPELSVAENVFIGRLPRRGPFVNRKLLEREAQRWLDLVGFDVDPSIPAGSLSPGQGQLLEIARALSLESRYLLLDEPTASIGEGEAQNLFAVLRRLREAGQGLLFVSHKLDEVYELCDRITVIRDGCDVIDGAPLSEVSRQQLVEAMVGREFVHVDLPPRSPGERVALELRGLSTVHGHREVDLRAHEGEIVALYGLVGAGRSELARAIVGLDRVLDGDVLVDGAPARVRTPASAIGRYGIGYVSEDRKGEGLILADSIRSNASMAIWDRCAGWLGYLSAGRTWPKVEGPLGRLSVKMHSPRQNVGELSGGNQQKVSAAKWLAADAGILIFDEPSVGIDVGAKDEMHHLLWQLAMEGKTVIMISSDLREVVQLADRVLVMGANRILVELRNTHFYEEMSRRIMDAIVRSDEDPAAPPVQTGEAG